LNPAAVHTQYVSPSSRDQCTCWLFILILFSYATMVTFSNYNTATFEQVKAPM